MKKIIQETNQNTFEPFMFGVQYFYSMISHFYVLQKLNSVKSICRMQIKFVKRF